MAHVSDMHATILKLCNLPYEGTSVFDLDESEERTRRYLYYPTTRENGGTLPLLTEYNVGRGQAFTETGVTLPGGADALK